MKTRHYQRAWRALSPLRSAHNDRRGSRGHANTGIRALHVAKPSARRRDPAHSQTTSLMRRLHPGRSADAIDSHGLLRRSRNASPQHTHRGRQRRRSTQHRPSTRPAPSRHVTPRHATSHHVTSRHVTSRHATSRHVTSSQAKSSQSSQVKSSQEHRRRTHQLRVAPGSPSHSSPIHVTFDSMGPRRALYIAPLSDAPTWNQPSIMSRSPSHAPSAPTSARTSSSSAQPLTPPEDQ